MPNYAINAVYQPFSFQERLAPLQMMKEEYDNVGLTLNALGEEANAWQQYIDPNSRAGQTLAQYNKTLADTADSLSSEGLKAVSRNTLFALRRAYNQDISKINKAAQTLATMHEQYRTMGMKDPTLMMGKMPSVDDLLDNPSATPLAVSGQQLYAQSAAAAKAASARNTKSSSALDGTIRGYYHLVQETGYDSEDVQRFLANAANIPELQAAMQQVREMYGTEGLSNPGQADTYILRGILDGMTYNKKEDWKQDVIGAENRAYARQRQLAAQQAAFNANVPLNPRNLRSQKERSEEAKTLDYLQSHVGNYIKLGPNGYELTKRGQKAVDLYKEDKKRFDDYIAEGGRSDINKGGYYKFGEEFISFLQDIGGLENPEEAINKYVDSINTYDAHQATEYQYRIAGSQQDDWLQSLMSTARDGNLFTVDFDSNLNKFVTKDKKSLKDLEKAKVVSYNVSPYGQIAEVQMKDGSTEYFQMSGYNPTVEQQIGLISEDISNGEQNISDIKNWAEENLGYTGPEDTRSLLAFLYQSAQSGDNQAAMAYNALLQEWQNYTTNQAGLMTAISQLGNTFKTKETEMSGYNF